MPSRYASSKNVLAICDVCGFQYKLRELRSVITRGRDTNIKACPECWDEDHPPVGRDKDPFSLTPNNLVATGAVGTVSVTT